jgi:hypothetical protein
LTDAAPGLIIALACPGPGLANSLIISNPKKNAMDGRMLDTLPDLFIFNWFSAKPSQLLF